MNTKGWTMGLALALAGCAADDGEDDGAVADDGSAGDDAMDDGGSGDDGSDDAGAGMPDAEAILAAAADYEASFVQINAEDRDSQHALGATVNMWAAADVAELYASIDPDAGGADVEFAPGSILVKEHLTEAGEFNGLTIMFKAEAGYDPMGQDWWWGRTNAALELAEEGMIGYCRSCHTGAADSDFVYGVPLDNRM